MTATGVTQLPTAPTAPRLFEGETILASGQANPRLLWQQAATSTVLLGMTIVLLPLLPVAWWASQQAVAQHRWWLTNQRLLVANGVIGRTVRSVPLDRIVDVTVRSTWWDKVWGFEHVSVRDMTGEVAAAGVSTGLVLQAVDCADDVADTILTSLPQRHSDGDLVDALRRLIAA